jgi:actin-related protein
MACQNESIPAISEFEASEFSDSGDSGDKKVIKIIIPENRATAIFNGASILGSLDSFKKLFVNYEQFIQDPNCIESEFSQIL